MNKIDQQRKVLPKRSLEGILRNPQDTFAESPTKSLNPRKPPLPTNTHLPRVPQKPVLKRFEEQAGLNSRFDTLKDDVKKTRSDQKEDNIFPTKTACPTLKQAKKVDVVEAASGSNVQTKVYKVNEASNQAQSESSLILEQIQRLKKASNRCNSKSAVDVDTNNAEEVPGLRFNKSRDVQTIVKGVKNENTPIKRNASKCTTPYKTNMENITSEKGEENSAATSNSNDDRANVKIREVKTNDLITSDAPKKRDEMYVKSYRLLLAPKTCVRPPRKPARPPVVNLGSFNSKQILIEPTNCPSQPSVEMEETYEDLEQSTESIRPISLLTEEQEEMEQMEQTHPSSKRGRTHSEGHKKSEPCIETSDKEDESGELYQELD